MPRHAWLLGIFGLALVVTGSLVFFQPWLEREHAIPTTTPGLFPLFARADIPLAPGSTACVAPVRLDPALGRALIIVRSSHGAQPLRFVATGPGYKTTTIATTPATSTDEQLVATLLPPTQVIDGRLCVTNDGRHTVVLVATNEARSLTISKTTVDGHPAPADARAVLLILEPHDRSPGSSFDELARHLSALSGGSVPVWLVWPLSLLFVLGVPLMTFVALVVALRR